jgi:serine/threonine protein phosphatase 1
VPEGELVYAIGDVHGRADLLADLLAKIEADAGRSSAARRTLVFLGDYIDRGPQSSGVIEILVSALPDGFDARFLKGNHEALLLAFLADPAELDRWLMNGGEATMRSYGVDTERLARFGAGVETWRQTFAANLPPSHLAFFRSLELAVAIGDYLFVHAGVRPGVKLSDQIEADLVWIRRPFLDHADPFEKLVVHGHTPGPEVVVRENRIGIDTGACFTDRLTALRLEGTDRGFLQTSA